MENSLSPAFVEIDYVSAEGPHTMTIPTVPLIEPVVAGGEWFFDLRGANVDVAIQSAIEDFVNVIKVYWKPTTTFVSYTAFEQADPDSPPHPVASGLLNIAGTSPATTLYEKANQATFTWRTDEFGIFKLVFLDIPLGGYDKVVNLATHPNEAAVNTYVTSTATWMAGRDGGRPNTFLQVSFTLNEKLRRSYKLN